MKAARRGISNIVGAIIAVPVIVALLLAALYAGSAISASTALYAQRVEESISMIPVVNATGVYAEVINSGSQAARVLYIVSRNLTDSTLTVIPVNVSLDPGDSITVKLANSTVGRLAAYAISALGGVYPWDPKFTIDGVLDLPQEPVQAGGGGLGEDMLATIWLAQVLGPDYPGICSLEAVYVNPNISVNIPYVGAYGEGLYFAWWSLYWAEANATAGNVTDYMYDYINPAEAWAKASQTIPAGPLGPINTSLLLAAEAWGYADSAGASAWAKANATLILEPRAGYAAVVVTRPAVATGGVTVSLGGFNYSVAVAQPGSPAGLQLEFNSTRMDTPVSWSGFAYAYAEATLPSGPRSLYDFIDYLAVYVYKCP